MDISYAFIAIAAVAAVLLFLLLKTYNGLIKMRNAVQSGWSDIDVQLTRRHDLVPNLVEAVKGYMTHERETLGAVTRARTKAVAAGGGASLPTRAMAEMALTGAVSNLFATTERYPALKASQQKSGMIQLDSQAKALIESVAALRAEITAKEVEISSLSLSERRCRAPPASGGSARRSSPDAPDGERGAGGSLHGTL